MITIEPEALQVMNNDAMKAFPDECCGFMFGVEDAEGIRKITQAMPVHNSSDENKKRRFKIAPADYMKGERHALDNNLQLLGIYHSHPNHPAIPSEHDRVAAQPWFSYLILSVDENAVQS